jgi:hypothetical protein
MTLPFKIDSKLKPQSHTISDGLGHSLDIPKYGCLSVEETEIYHDYTLKAMQDGNNQAFVSYKIELVYRLLCSRFSLPEETNRSDLFSFEDGSPWTEILIDEFYQFFENERLRWKEPEPVTETEGKP